MQKIEITNLNDPLRVDVVIAQILNITRSAFKSRIMKNSFKINGKNRSISFPVNNFDVVEFELEEIKSLNAKPQNIPLSIIFEDESLLIVNKQSSLVVHAGGGTFDNTLVNGVLFYLNLSNKFEDKIRPGIVHRLDKDTSGVIIIAKTEYSKAFLQKQFANREITKEYHAIVYSNISKDEQIIQSPIGRDPIHRKKMIVNGINAKTATTQVNVLNHFGNVTYIKALPKTGRTHQIRVHLSSIGHPIVGDKVYASTSTHILGKTQINRQMLHAHSITFIHPVSNKVVQFSAPVPQDMESILHKLKNITKL